MDLEFLENISLQLEQDYLYFYFFKISKMKTTLILLLSIVAFNLTAQNFHLGADLSYTNEMEDCGAVFYENQEAKDPFLFFDEHHANIARFRIWHFPNWMGVLKTEGQERTN